MSEERRYTIREIEALQSVFGTPKLLLTVNEAAAALALTRSRMYDLIRDGRVRTIKEGKSRRVPLRELEAWVERTLQEQDDTWESLLTAARGGDAPTTRDRSTSGRRTRNG